MGMKLHEALEEKNSAQLQLDAYYMLREARRFMASSLLQGKREYRLSINKIKKAVKDRDKDQDGKVYDAMDGRDMEQKLILWVAATTKQLRAVAEYEVSMLDIITNRGLYPTEETLETTMAAAA